MAEWVPNSLLLRENVEGPTTDCVAKGQARWRYVKPNREVEKVAGQIRF